MSRKACRVCDHWSRNAEAFSGWDATFMSTA